MRKWVENFFSNKQEEVELNTNSVKSVAKILKKAGWKHIDKIWTPDLQIDLFTNGEQRLHLLQKTFFNLQISGTKEVISQVLITLKDQGGIEKTFSK